jgi:hypothetical protein
MRNKRSRLALFGMLALALSVTVGLSAGVADAKKKKGKKGGAVTVTDGASHLLPPAIPVGGPFEVVASQTLVTLNTSNKKTKGKAISADSVTATYAISGTPVVAGADSGGPGLVAIALQHRGRESGLPRPFDGGTALIGKVTVSPNTNVGFCAPVEPAPPPPCPDPADSCLRPYTCTVQGTGLTIFSLMKSKGPWVFRLLNFGSSFVTVNQLSVTFNQVTAPA